MRTLSRPVKYLIKSLCNHHKQGAEKNIFLFSVPRSGSTWLMELIASQPGFKYYDEPLNIRRANVKKVGIFKHWEALIPGGGNDDLSLSYFRNLSANKLGFMNPSPFTRNHRFFSNRIVFKVLVIEHMMNVIEEKLNAQIVFLLRHPIATTISRNQLPRFRCFVESEHFQQKYLSNEQRACVHDIDNSGTEFEKGVLSWCFQNLLPLKYLEKKDWVIITYEEMVLNAYKSCRILCEKLALGDLDTMLRLVGLPAKNIQLSSEETVRVVQSDDDVERRRALVTKWKNKASNRDEERAFEILSIFGIDAYSRGQFVANDMYLHFKDTRNQLRPLENEEAGTR